MTINRFDEYELSEEILRALASLKYETPTEVQREVIPQALAKRDVIVKSQTGSGKTASFGIPICELVEWEENKPQVLILTPTRELAVQVKEDLTNIGRFKRIKAVALYGKEPFAKQQLELKQKTHVVVGTPGRVMDHIERGTLVLDQVSYLIIDEADEMLNMGFIEQMEGIIRELPEKRVTSVFSATLPKDVETLCYKYMENPVEIEIKSTGITTETIEHVAVEVKQEAKFGLLTDLLTIENPDTSIIFCRTKENVDTVFEKLERAHVSVEKIHGGMVQEDRFSVMNGFKMGNFRYLVATDVAARGIDIENISTVINYDLPMEKESYVHRTGRTGRAGKSGKAITFVTPFEGKFLAAIEQYIGFEIPKIEAPSKEEVARSRASFDEKKNTRPQKKKAKSDQLNKSITKLYFNGGKKKKIRAVDFVGTIAKIKGVTADDIGIITIQDNVSYVEILNGKGQLVLKAMRDTTVKGKLLRVHEANK